LRGSAASALSRFRDGNNNGGAETGGPFRGVAGPDGAGPATLKNNPAILDGVHGFSFDIIGLVQQPGWLLNNSIIN
jgi:hypothetical protein